MQIYLYLILFIYYTCLLRNFPSTCYNDIYKFFLKPIIIHYPKSMTQFYMMQMGYLRIVFHCTSLLCLFGDKGLYVYTYVSGYKKINEHFTYRV